LFSIFKKKYSEQEQEYLSMLAETARLNMPDSDSLIIAQRMLDECIKQAVKLGMRGYDKRGDDLVKDDSYVSLRLNAGLTLKDIITFWNRDFVWILAEEKMGNAIRMAVYLEQKNNHSPEDSVLICRKMFIYYGDPNKTHERFTGDDADIYHEFAQRHEAWRSRLSIEHVGLLSDGFSTYNAMVRNLIRVGKL